MVIHPFDDVTKYIKVKTDAKVYPNMKEIYVGEHPLLRDIKYCFDSMPHMTRFDKVSRQMWFYTCGLWPKRNDCVDKCSKVLNKLFNTPICYSTPDKLERLINDSRR
jgi:hypothetical protein